MTQSTYVSTLDTTVFYSQEALNFGVKLRRSGVFSVMPRCLFYLI